MALKKTLTIAGSDTSGGAGIQADLKTFQEHGTYGMTAVTVVVTMDPDQNWSHNVYSLPIDVVKAQLKTALSTGIDAIKTGMLSTEEIIQTAGQAIDESGLDHVVIDPVMVCKGEDEVLNPGNTDAMIKYLVPKAEIVTPNLFEAGQLASMKTPKTIDDMKVAAQKIHELGARNVVIKGGKQLEHEEAVDLFYDGLTFTLLKAERSDTYHNHGAGCTFAAAITANLANGLAIKDAVIEAKQFVTAAIAHGWKLNEYVGPVMHGAKNQFDVPQVELQEV
ncbi:MULTISPECIES: bifunctional hydroxymethylpyrimidine kinase/phosphomethylpyrimidine kinase [unclassified Sporosarcina]|uniref:bifunctional hydroxymethylpyrimidine kinase/phosphomethylpyrimidine kinase n=1 Tax=unclassified Sporosarcina TaxID=2647733 RepID=UPI000C16AC31|nr:MULTISPECIES: bifunctional hydroxymethylpyrimidine kinase/phosphomethylpyrimidine kinase [unclassified Sporosarcina]PIC98050.1 bifunctional hydroxymethylpyrimidine kinase/phosphomethylpyrimidine kinase [Sporosarcina sp. P29]PID05326.1 bifunctional hydroxymethylpyrimidine kinase/phosphomethylpyrimidine kinase [Sporosarcina sp. P30]PID08444.1 bifunctional hydroxymethylpyrimidine kinase/phosphomethylpyrimidine kinase [Sporosarcina sp. P31]PID12228.1 bifunctional hydroxymethylpyrimidine kinase/p